MPNENRSECLPFSNYNEPPLQRALLEFLVAEWPKSYEFKTLLADERFGQEKWPLLRAVKSLHIGNLVFLQDSGNLIATEPARHSRWLWTEVEPVNA